MAISISFLVYLQAQREYQELAASTQPFMRLEPEHGVLLSDTGYFTLTAVNGGADIDHIWITRNYFVAQIDERRNIRFKNILTLECGPDRVGDVLPVEFTPSSDFEGTIDGSVIPISVKQVVGGVPDMVFRTNQPFRIVLTHAGWVSLAYKTAKSSFVGQSLLGIRVILAFRRFSDQREFKNVYVFELAEDKPDVWSLSSPSEVRIKRPSVGFNLEDVASLMQSVDRWSGLQVHYKGGKAVSAY
jgi:hypothetical protein